MKRNVALFFYTGALAATDVQAIEKYYVGGGGYTGVNFRRIPDNNYNPVKDIIEEDWTIIGGAIPSTYQRFATDNTYIIDTTAQADIISGKATTPPKATSAATAAGTPASSASTLTPTDSSASANTAASTPSSSGTTVNSPSSGSTNKTS